MVTPAMLRPLLHINLITIIIYTFNITQNQIKTL